MAVQIKLENTPDSSLNVTLTLSIMRTERLKQNSLWLHEISVQYPYATTKHSPTTKKNFCPLHEINGSKKNKNASIIYVR